MRKFKLFTLGLVMCLALCMMTACGTNDNDNTDNKTEDNKDNRDTDDNKTDKNGTDDDSIVSDSPRGTGTDGGNVGTDMMDTVEDVGDDIVDGVTDIGDDLTGNGATHNGGSASTAAP